MVKGKAITVTARCQLSKTESQSWSIMIEKVERGAYEILARGTLFTIYIRPQADSNALVSIPDLQRCGSVPPCASYQDIQRYCDIDSPIDATTISVALEAILHGKGGE